MIAWISDRLKARRQARRKAGFDRGYDWAAGQLLRNETSEEAIAAFASGSFNHSEAQQDFDRGVLSALYQVKCWRKVLEALELGVGMEHTLPYHRTCTCSQCIFVRARAQALARIKG